MTHAAIRNTLSALAAVALVSAFASGPVTAQTVKDNAQYIGETQLVPKKKAKGLATKKSSQPYITPLIPTDVPAVNYSNPETTVPLLLPKGGRLPNRPSLQKTR